MGMAEETMSTDTAREVIISICIANYNGHDIIRECIDSVYQQETDIPFEVIIHDDASSDNSTDIIRTEYPDAVLLESNTNVGFCISNNRMVDVARGKYLLLLNNDATLDPGAISSLYSFSEANNLEGILSLPQLNMANGELIDCGYVFDPFMNPVPVTSSESEVGMIIGACLWIPKHTWELIGGFPEWFGSIAEDMLLCCQARLMGKKVMVLPSPCYRHRVGKSFGGGKVVSNKLETTIKRRALSERNKTFVMLLTYPPTAIAALLPLHLLLLFVEGLILMIANRQPRIFSRIYGSLPIAILKNYAHLKQLRNNISTYRAISYKDFFHLFKFTPWKLHILFRHGFPKIK